ncbi:MAG: hypothetical protein ACK4EX_09585 [Thermaurantimonas sp.]|uniref:hypothetical protein n=1 Tax=Thermaurantimonas sp. TaxID=2681568 RepID=UPI003918FC4E
MKSVTKISLLFFSFLLILTSCKRESSNDDANGDPLLSLPIEEKTFILLTNTFGPNDPNSGGAAALFQVYNDYLPGRIFMMNIPSQNNVAYKAGVTDSVINTFFKKPPVPALHLNNEFVDLDLAEKIDLVSNRSPNVGVNHLVADKGDYYEVRAKVKILDFFYTSSFYITSYLLGDFEPKDYGGGVNFSTQPLPGVTEISNGRLSYALDVKSLRDTSRVVVRKGDPVMHYRVLLSTDSVAFAPGLLLDTINIFGRSFDAGDIFGLQQTPLRFKLPKTPASEVAANLYVVTMVFRKEDGDQQIRLENSYQTRIR